MGFAAPYIRDMTVYEKDTYSCYLQREFAVSITKLIEINDTKLLLNNKITTYTFALVLYNTATGEGEGHFVA